jgi:hypothetical protein
MDPNHMTTLRRRYASWQASVDRKTRAVLLTFIVLAVLPLLIGELTVLLSPHRDATVAGIVFGFVILVTILATLLTSLALRRRWAWSALVLLFGSAVIISVLNATHIVIFALEAICFALLLSTPMRRYVNRVDGP